MRETIIDKEGRKITRMDISDLGPITQQERDMIRDARQRKVEYDEDCPPLSRKMLEEVERQIAARARIS